ncbi:hypothetical protein PMAYCL1PPCAC_13231, partial [Pristionchus mayeri]
SPLIVSWRMEMGKLSSSLLSESSSRRWTESPDSHRFPCPRLLPSHGSCERSTVQGWSRELTQASLVQLMQQPTRRRWKDEEVKRQRVCPRLLQQMQHDLPHQHPLHPPEWCALPSRQKQQRRRMRQRKHSMIL